MSKTEFNSPSFSTQATHLFVFCVFAITQPTLALFEKSPQFFFARGAHASDILLWLLILVFAVPIFLTVVLALVSAVNRHVGRIVYNIQVLLLVVLVAIPVLMRTGYLSDKEVLIGASCIALVFLLLYLLFEPVKQLLTFLVIGLVAFPLSFILHPDLRPYIFAADEATRSTNVDAKSLVEVEPISVVMVVFDELPLFSLLNKQRLINEHRYPNFARLAATSTWYRNASAMGGTTLNALPAILTGQYPPEEIKMPNHLAHPQNLFTLMGNSHVINAAQGFGTLCPPNLCEKTDERALAERIRLLLEDSVYVYAHIVVPRSYAQALPAVNQGWQGFGGGRDNSPGKLRSRGKKRHFPKNVGHGDRHPPEYTEPLTKFIDSIKDPRTPQLDYLHVVLPHVPFKFLPSGKRYNGEDFKSIDGLTVHKWTSRWPAIQGLQRALLQLAYVDLELGKLLTKLESSGVFDKALVIITADHGASYHPYGGRRLLTRKNYMDILPVPLFIKMPGQRTGAIDDSNVETVDIVPTIADALNIQLTYEVDGSSLLDKNRPIRQGKKARPIGGRTLETYPTNIELTGVDTTIDMFGVYPEDIYRHGPDPKLIDRSVRGFKQVENSSFRLDLRLGENIEALNPEDAVIPARVFGIFHVSEGLKIDEAMPLAVAVNGTIAATVWSYRETGKTLFSAMLPEQAFAAGKNEITIYAIGHDDVGVTLSRIAPMSD